MAKGGFRGGYGGNQMNMMRQAQKMQQDFLKMQEELEKLKAAADEKHDREVVSFDNNDKDPP